MLGVINADGVLFCRPRVRIASMRLLNYILGPEFEKSKIDVIYRACIAHIYNVRYNRRRVCDCAMRSVYFATRLHFCYNSLDLVVKYIWAVANNEIKTTRIQFLR